MLTFEQIKELIDLVSQRQLQGLEIERAGFRLKIDGEMATPPAPAVVQVTASQAAPVASAAASEPVPASPAPAAAPTADSEAESDEDFFAVNSPIVGTFYAAPSPDSPPFTKVGDEVSKGQVLCIVEAMKLMNEIECPVNGTVKKILGLDGQAVEFGQPLFLIDEA